MTKDKGEELAHRDQNGRAWSRVMISRQCCHKLQRGSLEVKMLVHSNSSEAVKIGAGFFFQF